MEHDNYGGVEYGILQRFELNIHEEKPTKGQFGFQTKQSCRKWTKSAPPVTEHPRCRSPRPPRSPNKLNWAVGGPGMQAVFLGSNPRSFGTGVFLPRRSNTEFQPINKPAFSPVLLPSRVVDTLNLNVHELGLQIKPPQDQPARNIEKIEPNSEMTKNADDIYYSPEIFLPKEWIY